MRLMRVLAAAMLAASMGSEAGAAGRGGELGNSLIPFASKIGGFSLEYPKDWHYNDLSSSVNFADSKSSSRTGSFFAVFTDQSSRLQNSQQLLERLQKESPDVSWTAAKLAGLEGWQGVKNEVRTIYLLRAPGDAVAVRLRSSDGDRSDQVLAHMLESFRLE